MTCAVYWIHHPSHTDIFSQGYVGVSVNTDVRFRKHKRAKQNAHLRNAITKYGWDNLVKKTVLIADTDYCLDVETKLRNKDDIGWNIVKGGGMPPNAKGKTWICSKPAWNKGLPLSEDTKQKISAVVTEQMKDPARREINRQVNLGNTYMRGRKHTAKALVKMSESHKGKTHRLGVKNSPETIEKMKQLAVEQRWTCVHCNKTGLAKGAGIRWHFDNCKFKEQ
jgi:group I intron endonuclease